MEILTGFPVVKIDIYIPDYIHDHAQKLLSDPAKILMECKKNCHHRAYVKKHFKKDCSVSCNSHCIFYGCQMSETAHRKKLRDSLNNS